MQAFPCTVDVAEALALVGLCARRIAPSSCQRAWSRAKVDPPIDGICWCFPAMLLSVVFEVAEAVRLAGSPAALWNRAARAISRFSKNGDGAPSEECPEGPPIHVET